MQHQDIRQQMIKQRASIVDAVVRQYLEANPDFEARFGANGVHHTRQDTDYHLGYLIEATTAEKPVLFVDYINRARSILETRNLPVAMLLDSLEQLRAVLLQEIDEAAHPIIDTYLDAAIQELGQNNPHAHSLLQPHMPYAELTRNYIQAVMDMDRRRASQLILDAVQQGVSVRDIYLHVFQTAQHEIGRRWQTNEINVAQEHYATAVTQLVMSQLYPHIFTHDKNGYTLIATCVGGELHEIGIRMVADFFEMDGWDTFYLGASTPAKSIVEEILKREAHLVAISVTIATHLDAARQIIELVRAATGQEVKILLGGYPFNTSPELWQQFGVDGHAPDAASAVKLGTQLVTQGNGASSA